MTPNEMNVVKSLVAVAWADGHLAQPESGVIEGLLSAFGASDEEEREILDFARERRTLADIPLSDLSRSDRELLLTNAALLTHVDGVQTEQEKQVLGRLIGLLGVDPREAARLLDGVALGTEG